MAWRMRRDENRNDVCAQPYGINTPGAFAFALSIILPDFLGPHDESMSLQDKQEQAWRLGIGANYVAAAILLSGAIIGRWIARNVPLVPLFTSLSGIAMAYLCFNSLLDEFAYPIVGMFSLAVFFAEYFGDVRFVLPYAKVRMPASIIVLVCGSALGWATSLTGASDVRDAGSQVKMYAPMFTLSQFAECIKLVRPSLSIIIPTAVSNIHKHAKARTEGQSLIHFCTLLPCWTVTHLFSSRLQWLWVRSSALPWPQKLATDILCAIQ
jgi:AGZA family xanthine/uracil permease-like MFS transporter